jgi:uncharacterized protein (TIGR00299 family) protein
MRRPTQENEVVSEAWESVRPAAGGGALHLDCTSGIAGDMFLAACLEVGLPRTVLDEVVHSLGLDGVELEIRKARRGGIVGTRFRVVRNGVPLEGADPDEHEQDATGRSSAAEELHEPQASHAHQHAHQHPHSHAESDPSAPGASLARDATGGSSRPHGQGAADGEGPARGFRSLRRQVEECTLDPQVKRLAVAMLRRLAEVEAAMHGVDVDEVHFHEVGSVDSLVDIVGAAAAMHYLGPGSVTCSRLVLGSGAVSTAHGVLPVPSPAAAELLRGAPVLIGSQGELVTPTGALIVATFVTEFIEPTAALLPLTVERIGYGLGRRELEDRPNALRLLWGTGGRSGNSTATPRICSIECQVDDVTPEVVAYAVERLHGEGALDVTCSAVQMKKGRAGTLIRVLTRATDRDRLAHLLLSETGSLGCRFHTLERLELERRIVSVTWAGHPVAVKVGRPTSGAWRPRDWVLAPEYEDCRRAALAAGVPLRVVYEEVRGIAASELRSGDAAEAWDELGGLAVEPIPGAGG